MASPRCRPEDGDAAALARRRYSVDTNPISRALPAAVAELVARARRLLESARSRFADADDGAEGGRRWSTRLALAAAAPLALVAASLLLVETLVQLWLPFYALFSAFFSFGAWRRRRRRARPGSADHANTEVAYSLFALCLFDLTVRQAFGAERAWVYAASQLLPLIAFALLRCRSVDAAEPLGTDSDLVLCAAVCARFFALRVFTALPVVLRTPAGAFACLLGERMAASRPQPLLRLLPGEGGGSRRGERSSITTISPPVSASRRFGGLSDGDVKAQHLACRNRRTSLPASQTSLVMSRAQNNASEAAGLVADMLANRDLPMHVYSGLKAISTLLNAHPTTTLHMNLLGLPRIVQDPFSGDPIDVSGATKPRVANITFSTVTSATGLPTIVAEPSRARSSSFWKLKEESLDDAISDDSALEESTSVVRAFSDGRTFNLDEMDENERLAHIDEWGFPIFRFAERHSHTMLTRMAYTVFRRVDLFRIFRIPHQKFINFFHALEMGYWEIPYHNRIHATDVLHACFYLTCHRLPACPSFDEGGGEKTLLSSFSGLELLALFTAAAMHDFDHPGRTNAFLVATEDPKAILYNDRSVLENHHAAAAWHLLRQTQNNFLDHLDVAEFKRLRYLVVELILATDLKRHFELIMDFTGKTKSDGMLDLDQESDRLLLSQICIKVADINSPTKPQQLHQRWTERIVEEFCLQGDEERAKGMAISPYMDREEPQVAKLQDSFIAHIVLPLVNAVSEAGFLPADSADDDPELLVHLHDNHQFWSAQLSAADSPSAAAANAAANAPPAVAPLAEHDDCVAEDSMATIDEGDEDCML